MADAVQAQPGGTRSPVPGFLRESLDGVLDGIVVLGADGCCRYLNESARGMLGGPAAHLLDRQIWDALPEALGLTLRGAFEAAADPHLPARLVERDANRGVWLESRVFPHDGEIVIVIRDVTDEQLAHDELLEYVDRFSEAERIVRFGVWEWEIANGRVRWSDELHRIYGLRPGDFGGTVDAFMEMLHPEDRDRVWANIARSIETLEPFVFEERIKRAADGEERVLLSQGRVIANIDGSPRSLVGVCHDVTDRAKIERALGASERRMRAIIDNTPSLIAVKDLSGRYLMSNAESGRILGMRPDEIVGNHCADLFPPEIAEVQRANDRRAASDGEPVYSEVVLVRDGEPRNYFTSTFALPDDEGFPVETCTIATDVTERREYESARRERREWTQRIASALDEDRIVVFAQPIIDLSTGSHVLSELLVRMRTAADRSELLLPSEFLPSAERFGLIQSIDVWMVRQAIAFARDVMTSVNLSAMTICDPAARLEIVDLLKAAPGAARRIVFEITETAAASHLEAAAAFVGDIGRLGCRLALDDFGTGFGSFTYLRTLPLSHIKIDLSFVRGLADSVNDRRVVQSILGIAEQFGLATIAEGVENQATLDLLRELGADYAQGFHVGRPEPVPLSRN